MTDDRDKKRTFESKKRPYHRPRLSVYGDVNNLTRAMDIMGTTKDGGTWGGPFNLPLYS